MPSESSTVCAAADAPPRPETKTSEAKEGPTEGFPERWANTTRAALALGISRRTLRRWAQKYSVRTLDVNSPNGPQRLYNITDLAAIKQAQIASAPTSAPTSSRPGAGQVGKVGVPAWAADPTLLDALARLPQELAQAIVKYLPPPSPPVPLRFEQTTIGRVLSLMLYVLVALGLAISCALALTLADRLAML